MFFTEAKLEKRSNELSAHRYRDVVNVPSLKFKLEVELDVVSYPPFTAKWESISWVRKGRDLYAWLSADVHIPAEWQGKKVVDKLPALPHNNEVVLVKLSEYNRFAKTLNLPTEKLTGNEARFIPAVLEQIEPLADEKKTITLKESDVTIDVIGSVGQLIFKSYSMGSNIILVSDDVYDAIDQPLESPYNDEYEGIGSRTYFGYKVDDWQATKDVGKTLDEQIREAYEHAAREESSNKRLNP